MAIFDTPSENFIVEVVSNIEGTSRMFKIHVLNSSGETLPVVFLPDECKSGNIPLNTIIFDESNEHNDSVCIQPDGILRVDNLDIETLGAISLAYMYHGVKYTNNINFGRLENTNVDNVYTYTAGA